MKKTLLVFVAALSFILVGCQCPSSSKKEGQTCESKVTVVPMESVPFKTIKLQAPDTLGGVSLMTAMQHRHSNRVFTESNLSMKHLSEIMWAAYGVNRPEEGKRTVPSSLALYPLEIYAFMTDGVFKYDPIEHKLIPVLEGDHRFLTGDQPFVETAPLNLAVIANYNKYNGEIKIPQDRRLMIASLDAGHVSQNVYLYCASEGIKVTVRDGRKEKEKELLKVLNLDDKNYKFLLTLSVGY